jgi:outer membrane protein
LALAIPSAAQEAPATPWAAPAPLTLEEAWARALKDSLAVERARAEVGFASAQKRGAFSLVLPRISVGANAIRNSDEVAFGSAQDRLTILPRNDWSLRAILTQPLFAGLREKRAYDQAKEEIVSAQQGLLASEEEVLLRVARDYLAVVFGEALMEVERRSVELAEKRKKQAADFLEAGESTRVEVLQAEAFLKAAERRLVTARQARERAAGALRVELGLEGEIHVQEPEGSLPSLAPEAELVTQALESRPDLRRAQSAVRVAALEVQKQQGAYLPVLTADAGYVRQKTTFPKDEYAFAALRLTVPVFQGGEVGARVAAARERERQAQLALEQTRRQVKEEVRTALLDLQAATTSLALAKEQLAAAQGQYDQVFDLYRGQEATALDVETAENGLAEARRAEVTERLQRKFAALRVRFAAGSRKASVLKEVLP